MATVLWCCGDCCNSCSSHFFISWMSGDISDMGVPNTSSHASCISWSNISDDIWSSVNISTLKQQNSTPEECTNTYTFTAMIQLTNAQLVNDTWFCTSQCCEWCLCFFLSVYCSAVHSAVFAGIIHTDTQVIYTAMKNTFYDVFPTYKMVVGTELCHNLGSIYKNFKLFWNHPKKTQNSICQWSAEFWSTAMKNWSQISEVFCSDVLFLICHCLRFIWSVSSINNALWIIL